MPTRWMSVEVLLRRLMLCRGLRRQQHVVLRTQCNSRLWQSHSRLRVHPHINRPLRYAIYSTRCDVKTTVYCSSSNLATGGIARTGGSDPKSPLPVGEPGTCLINITWNHTSVSAKWHLILSVGFSRVHECDRQRDRQSDGPRADMRHTRHNSETINAEFYWRIVEPRKGQLGQLASAPLPMPAGARLHMLVIHFVLSVPV